MTWPEFLQECVRRGLEQRTARQIRQGLAEIEYLTLLKERGLEGEAVQRLGQRLADLAKVPGGLEKINGAKTLADLGLDDLEKY